MILIYIIVAIAFIDTFSQLPIIATFAKNLGANPLLIGVIIGMYSLSNMLGNIISGIYIDRIGSKKILYVGMIIVGIIVWSYSLVTTPNQLLAVRFVHGFAGGFIVPAAFTLIGSKGDRRSGRTMAFSGAAVGIAAIIGPAFGAIVTGRIGIDWVFYIVSLLMVIFGIIAAVYVKENMPAAKQNQSDTSSFLSILKVKPLIQAYISIFLLLFTLGILTYSLPMKIAELNMKQELAGILLSLFGVVAILFFLLPTNKLFDKSKKTTLMNIGLLTVSISLFALSISNSILMLVISMIIFGLGFSLLFPSTSSVVVEFATKENRGKAFGLFYACFSFGVIIGSFLAGFLAMASMYVFLVGAIILFIAAVVLGVISKQMY